MSDTDPMPAGDGSDESASDTATRVRRGLDYALLGGLVILGLVAAIQFYFAADRTINVWVTREFRPPFKMLFNLVILLVVGVGLSRQLRRLTGGDEEQSQPSDASADGGITTASSRDDARQSSATRTADRGTRSADDADVGDERL